MLEVIVAIFILASLIVYALMGGADFGGGIWNLLAFGVRAQRQREAIADAIAPIWEANHVWLILVIVLLFTGFPRGFATMMTALNIPMTVMLLGIVLRGSAFVFRKYDVKGERRWSTVFGMASFLTPFFQGVILGALTTGQIHVEQGRVLTGFMAGWLTPFALSRSEEHTSELQSRLHLVCRLLLEKKKTNSRPGTHFGHMTLLNIT